MKKIFIGQVFLMVSSVASLFAEDLPRVRATVQTESVPNFGDAADDMAIYTHVADPTKSIVIGTNKVSTTGLIVYDLAGKKVQSLSDGRMNNVDVRQGNLFSDEHIAIVAAGNRTYDSISVYQINPQTVRLKNISASKLSAGLGVYGSCLYFSKATNKLYFFVNSHEGEVIQWHLTQNTKGKIEATEVRRFNVGSQTEGCVADDELGHFYIGEENVGIWKYSAEPDGGDERDLLDSTGDHGHLVADVEGLTIYKKEDNKGYLIASSQGENAYAVYDREGDNKFLVKFQVIGLSKDIVKDTDGIDAESMPMGPRFPKGMFAVQDGFNSFKKQNFKYVPFESIEALLPTPKSIALKQ